MPQPRKLDRLHELHSTVPHDRSVDEPNKLVAGRPRYPKNLTPDSKRLYKLLCKQLEERHALTPGDQHLLTLFAEIWDRRERAKVQVAVQGEVVSYERLDSNGAARLLERPNYYLKILQDSERQLVAILDRLGLTPLAKSKVKMTRPDEAEEIVPGSMADLFPDIVGGVKR